MKRGYLYTVFIVFLGGLLLPGFLSAQIYAPSSEFTEETAYPVFEGIDSIYIFCAEQDVNMGELEAQTSLTDSKSFEWDKYNPLSGNFEFYFSETSNSNSSIISELEDGCYRVTITKGDTVEVYRAWVLNEWFEVSAKIIESNCDFFQPEGSFTSAQLVYYDLADDSVIEVYKNIQVEWKQGSDNIARVSNPQIFDPPTKDTEYRFTVYDRFGCSGETTVTYISIVTKAAFEIEADFNNRDGRTQQGEAPMEVTFTNTSENGTQGEYEWFFFRDLDAIKAESENSEGPIDSIMFVAYDDDLIYSYENTGTYMVKLVSKKLSSYHISGDSAFEGTCTDTTYMEDYIVLDSSSFDVPNVFTPNGDDTNDEFVVIFWSMLDAKVTIVNRWGRKVHYWEKTNIRRFEGAWPETVWDGRINGRMASPGVYYYVAEGMGRDGKKRWAHGFFHLFRGKD